MGAAAGLNRRSRRASDALAMQLPFQDRTLHLFCSHYAHRVWPKSHHGSLHLYGHSHGTLPDSGNRSMDVGVDTNKFRPYSLEDIVAKIGVRPVQAVDQHQPELRSLSGGAICSLCDREMCWHEKDTLKCPMPDNGGITQFHPTQYFALKRGRIAR